MRAGDSVKGLLLQGDNFFLASHHNPDGDAVGSLLGLGLALKGLGKRVNVLFEEGLPRLFNFLPGTELVRGIEELPEISHGIAVVLDCTSLERTGEVIGERLGCCRTMINIDHHVSNTGFGDFVMVDPGAAATGEIVFELLQEMGVVVTPQVATDLYVALVTDTGSFQHLNTTARCHANAAKLLDCGADHSLAYRYLYEEKPLKSIRLLKKCLETLAVSPSGKIAWMSVLQEHLKETGCSLEDSEDLVGYPKSIQGVEVGLLFKEAEDEIRVSFRSKALWDVNLIASHFGGGGHKRAAGCTIKGSLEEARRQVLDYCEGFMAARAGGEI